MKKLFTYLVALVACFGISVNANAQFSATAEMYPGTSWEDGYKDVELDLAAVAEALGTDAATLVSTLDAWMNNEAPEEFLFQKNDFVPTSLSDYTADNRGFWMKLDGTVVSYGQKESEDGPELQEFYAFFWWNADEGKFFVRIGQMPNKLDPGAQGNATFVIAIGDKKATFDINLTIIEKETPDLPDPVTDLNALTIVGTKNVEWEQYQGQDATKKQVVDLTGVAEALGTTDEIIASNLTEFLFMTTLELKGESEASQKPYKTTTISTEDTATPYPGFWMAAVWDDEIEGFTEEVVRCNYSDHAAFRSMWSAEYNYNAETHELTSTSGWNNGTLELGTKYNFNLYIVYGDKAYCIHHVVTMVEKPTINPNGWIEVGSEDVNIEFEYSASSYPGGNISIDLDAVLALLGCEASDIKSYAPQDDQGNMSDDYDVANDGFWFTAEGFVCKWASGYFYAGPTAQNGWGEWLVGQYPGKSPEGAEFSTKLFLVYNEKYYTINLHVTIKKEASPEVEFESVVEYTLVAQTEPYNDYKVDNYPAIDLDALEAAIGTRNPKLYAWVKKGDDKEYSKGYNCNPSPGFWMDNEGYSVGWGNNSYVGASYLSDGTFQLFQMPGVNKLGDVWKGDLFLVNEETGKMATVHLKVVFGEVTNYEEVGSKEVTLIADPDTQHEVTLVDFSDAITALGLTDVASMLSGQCVAALTSDGTWSDPQIPSEGIAINDKGFFDTAATTFSIYMNAGDENFVEMSVDNETATEIADDFKLPVTLAIQREIEGALKQYTIKVSIVSLASVTGINEVKSTNAAVTYDLSGRRSDATRRGVYIRNGKKIVK